MKPIKAAVLGVGHVGAHVSYALAAQSLVEELVLLDHNEKKLVSEVQDLCDAISSLPEPVRITKGDFPDLKECDLLICCTGDITILQKNQDRIDELEFNLHAVDGFADKIVKSGFHGILLNISNPCDIITRHLAMKTGLPKGTVLGTGTCLDTSRLRSVLSQRTGIDPRFITAYMMGEHGNLQFSPRSILSFSGAPLVTLKKSGETIEQDWAAITQAAIDNAWVTFAGKLCTEYGIASAAARIVRAIVHDEHCILPVSFELDGEYGQSGLFAGIPCVIGANGVEQVVELPLSAEELFEFDQCCQGIRNNILLAAKIEVGER